MQTALADDPGRGTRRRLEPRCAAVHGIERPGLRRPAVRHAPHRRLAFDQEQLHAVPRARRARPRHAARRRGRAVEGRRRHACAREAGTVSAPAASKLGYGELAEAAMALPVPEKVTLKDPKDFRLIGQPTGRLDARAKSSGQPGLRHRRAPARHADRRGGASAGVRRQARSRWTTARRAPSRA